MLTRIFKNLTFSVFFTSVFDHFHAVCELHKSGRTDDFNREANLFFETLISIPYLFAGREWLVKSPDLEGIISLPESIFKGIYLKEIELIRQWPAVATASPRNIEEYLNKLLVFLRRLEAALLIMPARRYDNYLAISAFVVFFVVTLPFLKNAYDREHQEELSLAAMDERFYQQRIKDIHNIKYALEKYFEVNGSYPLSSGGWDGMYSVFGESKKEWIPGLVPGFIDSLPADPRNTNDGRKQYLYKSDGKDYKLISHYSEHADRIRLEFPDMIDPLRPTWAFGAWSENAENW